MILRPPRYKLFPTRRSSDLDAIPPLRMAERFIPENPEVHNSLGTALQRSGHKDEAQKELPSELWTSRSEEHTSELQSHVNLVCRLLLEKKNIDLSFRSYITS